MSDIETAIADTVALQPGRRVVGFVTDDASIAALRAGLSEIDAQVDIRRGSVRQAIRWLEREKPPTAVLVDVSGDDDPQSALDALSRVCPPDVQVFVVGDNTDITFYRLLVQDLGVTDYLPKPLTRDSVQRLLLARLLGLPSEPLGGRGGHVVAVCGARGGTGATTVAVSLALELCTATGGHVALLDLHLQGGTVALMLSHKPGPGLRIALENAERADSLFLERTAITIEPRLRMVAAEEKLDSVLRITEPGVARVLDVLRGKFNHIVVDLPMPLPPEMRSVLQQARQVVVVVTPDIAALRDAAAIRQLVRETASGDRTVMVLNRADMKGGLPRAVFEKHLGTRLDAVIPELGARLMEAVNLGIPAIRRVPALRRHLAALVREVSGTVQAAPSRSWLRRMFGK
jgi:pilus assembly protein CpaE